MVDEIIDQFLYADDSNRPWIIGFSGGKDSTSMLQLIWLALRKIKPMGSWQRSIYVICNDTLVENPLISSYVNQVLEKIQKAAMEEGLPIFVRKTEPRMEESFWVNVIGRGYPIPTNSFRWCTERLKINPTSRIIEDLVGQSGEAIVILGTRKSESATRAKSIKKHSRRGKRITPHPNHPNVYVYSPIKDLMLGEVWWVINAIDSPWGADNSQLFQIYRDASADDYECPTMVSSKNHKSCGQSRFGCWVCSVVSEDKSMSALIDNGFRWMKPLLDLRNQMVAERNTREARSPFQRSGAEAKNGMGTYAEDYKADLLRRLLLVQKDLQDTMPDLELISLQELVAIQVIWHRDLNFKHEVSQIYKTVYPDSGDMRNRDENQQKEREIMREVCGGDELKVELITDLLKLQKEKSLLNRKRGLLEDLQGRLEKYFTEIGLGKK